MANSPASPLEAAFAEVLPAAAGEQGVKPPDAAWPSDHVCLHAAVVVTPKGERVWYPCRSHEGRVHHFAAHWPACPGPWCRLPYSHHLEGTMHDIPSGTVEFHDAIGTVEEHG